MHEDQYTRSYKYIIDAWHHKTREKHTSHVCTIDLSRLLKCFASYLEMCARKHHRYSRERREREKGEREHVPFHLEKITIADNKIESARIYIYGRNYKSFIRAINYSALRARVSAAPSLYSLQLARVREYPPVDPDLASSLRVVFQLEISPRVEEILPAHECVACDSRGSARIIRGVRKEAIVYTRWRITF